MDQGARRAAQPRAGGRALTLLRPGRALLRRRDLVLALLLLASVLGYAALLRGFDVGAEPQERSFPAAPGGAGGLDLYAEILAVDPVAETMQLRLEFTPDATLRGRRLAAADRDITIELSDGASVRDLAFRAHEPMRAETVTASLAGSGIAAFPFDRWRARLSAVAYEGIAPPDRTRPLPLRVTLWEALPAWYVAAFAEGDGAAAEMRIGVGLRRSGALAAFALCVYAVIAVVAGTALLVGSLVFLRVRKVEPPLLGVLGASAFAVPALRGAMPGAPPLGVRADLLVVLWAEIAIALGLLLFVLTWAREGAKP